MAYTFSVRLTTNYDKGGMTKPQRIILHHWGVDGQKFDNIVTWFLNPASQVSAHYVVQAGRVTQMVSLQNRAWHCYGNNTNSIGIEARPECTAGDVQTVAELVAEIWKQVGKKLPIYGHKDFNNTSCPGRYYAKIDDIYQKASVIYDGGYEDEEVKLVVDGMVGTLTVKAAQKYFGTTVDGWISGQLRELREYIPSVYAVEYGDEGSELVEAMQTFLKKKGFSIGKSGVDGMWGKDTSVALQKFLQKQGFSVGKWGADGVFGTESAKALQKFLNEVM